MHNALRFEREEHYQLFEKKMDHPRKKYLHVPKEIDPVVEYFKFTELKKRVSNPFLPDNPYKHDFDSFVEAVLTEKNGKSEDEKINYLYQILEEKQRLALSLLN